MKQVRHGYKETEVGVIPEDWEVKRLGEVGEIIRGASPRPKGDRRFYGGDIPRLMVEDVTRDGKFVIPKVDYLTNEGAKRSRPCQKGTLTIVCSGTVGVVSILGVDACIHDGFLALINILKKYSTDYLYHSLSTLRQKFNSSATHGGVFTNLTTFGVRELQIPLPPTLAEQEKIATALSDTDSYIEKLERLIEKKKYIKTGAMQELLSGKKRLPGFGKGKGTKETPVGVIPEDWEVKKLGEVINGVVDNRGKTPPISKLGVPLVEVNSIYNQGKNPNLMLVSKYVSDETYITWFRSGHPKISDILIVTVGSAGHTSIMNNVKICIAQNLIALKSNENYSSSFIYYKTKESFFMKKIKEILMNGVQPSIKVPHLLNVQIPLPITLAEQEKIAEVLSDMDSEIEKLEGKLEKYKNIKQGMMQKLLTGAFRLV